MKISSSRSQIVTIVVALVLLALAACTQSGSPNQSASSNLAPADAADGQGASSDLPKVPFGNQPCRSLSADEQKTLGIAKPPPAKPSPGREPDGLAFDNTCDFGYQTLVYTTRSDYEYQRNNLRNPRHQAPGDLPGAFYDVLGNLWFTEKGYYVTLPNNAADEVRVKMARAITAKL